MKLRLGPGPVFIYEWLTTTRRWQLYAMRAGFLSAILVGIMFAWQTVAQRYRSGQTVSLSTLADFGQTLFTTIVTIEVTLVLLAAPAATASSICLDKARGTLDHMLATDLSNAEIILGKLGVRLVPVLGLIACVLPLAALAGLLGGIDPQALTGSFLTATACALLGCSLAATLSVWGRKTHEVLMLTYLVLIVWISSPLLLGLVSPLAGGSPPWSFAPELWEYSVHGNPYYLVFAPYTSPGSVGMSTYLRFLGICLGLSATLVGLAMLCVRRVALKQAGQSASRTCRARLGRRLRRRVWHLPLPHPSLDGNPVLWHEWHRSRQSRFMAVVWLLYTALGVLWTIVAAHQIATSSGNEAFIIATNTFQVAVGLLLLSVSAATSLAEERVRSSLDVLLSTPLSTFSILVGKWWGAFRAAPHVLVWPALATGFIVLDGGSWIQYVLLLGLVLTYSAVIASLGLALATWVSRLGRAVALCVSAYVVFSLGWLFLGLLAFPHDQMGLLLLMGSPLFGSPLATAAVASDERHMLGHEDQPYVAAGAFLWMLINGGVAALLFMAVLATFDRCLGRISEATGASGPITAVKDKADLQPDLSEWFADNPEERE
jgi:ABC-type transport system involved in multi-copper enzyme maturation permease subunit